MAHIYYLNNPPNPFWGGHFSSGLEDHPFFAPRGHHGHHRGPYRRHAHPWWAQNDPSQNEETASGREAPQSASQTSASTPGPSTSEKRPETDREAISSDSESDTEHPCPGKCGKGKRKGHAHSHGLGKGGRGGKGRHSMGPRGFYSGPGGLDARTFGHHHHHHPYASPFGHPHPFGGHHGRGPHHRGGPRGRGMHHGGPPPFGAGPAVPGFDFLRNLATQFGIPFGAPANQDVDFVPSVDVFDTPARYIVHVSLPGAKKEDLSIDYDPEESVLHLAGVVYRPGVNENLHQALVMEERAREVGVFEREIRLGTRKTPAAVIADEITAKLEDGVLNVIVPKLVEEPEPKKKVVVVNADAVDEKDVVRVDERASETLTPDESEESESEEEETREYVKIPVQ